MAKLLYRPRLEMIKSVSTAVRTVEHLIIPAQKAFDSRKH